jgi:uncharacterized membrane protein
MGTENKSAELEEKAAKATKNDVPRANETKIEKTRTNSNKPVDSFLIALSIISLLVATTASVIILLTLVLSWTLYHSFVGISFIPIFSAMTVGIPVFAPRVLGPIYGEMAGKRHKK